MAELAINPEQIDLVDVAILARCGSFKKIYVHWSAGHYNQQYADYHINIDGQGRIFKTCDGLNNPDGDNMISHTWHRNSGAIGIALDCCAGAACRMDWQDNQQGAIDDLGDEAPTPVQLETLYRVVQALVDARGLDYTTDSIMTHCEAAFEDDYGPGSGDPETRWDLWYINDNGELKLGGQLIRDKAAWYSRQGE